MMQPVGLPHLVWVYAGSLVHALDAATWLDTTRELRQLGWRVTLVAAGPSGQPCVRGVEVLCIPRPEIYLLRQFVFHGRLLRLILRQWATVDVILFHQASALWLLPLRPLRGLTGRRRPLLVMDVRSLHMPSRQGLKDRVRGVFHGLMTAVANAWVDGYLVITQRLAESLASRRNDCGGFGPLGSTWSSLLRRRQPDAGPRQRNPSASSTSERCIMSATSSS